MPRTSKHESISCLFCNNPMKNDIYIRTKDGIFHRDCLKEMLRHKCDNLTNSEADFLIDTEIKEYRNYLQMKRLNNIIKNKNYN